MSFCGKCGCQLNDDNQFCNNCGAPVPKELTESKSFVPKQVRSNNSSIREYPQSASTSGSYSLPNTSSEVSTMPETHETRKEVFSGVIHKCPHCGTVLEGFVVECPGCGYELRSEDSLSSVEKLSQRLENLESQRKTPTAKESLKDAFLGSFAPVDTVYAAKATLITSYPIPNTKEEILEFVILASSNINPEAIAGATKGDANLVQLYQKMLVEQNAWVSKMEQAYRKAQLSFPTDPVFLQVQQIYESVFRNLLLNQYGKCLLCGVSDHRLLKASHIKPWSKCEPKEKIDIYNGLLLCPNHDLLFDQGFISFDDTGKVICSNELREVDRVFMNIQPEMKIRLDPKNQKYMEYHRKNIFLK